MHKQGDDTLTENYEINSFLREERLRLSRAVSMPALEVEIALSTADAREIQSARIKEGETTTAT